MPKTKVKKGKRKFYLTKNIFVRRKIWKYRNKACSCCNRRKRLSKSTVFHSDKNRTWFNETRRRWIYDYNDYAWVCRHCLSKLESGKRLKIVDYEWEKAKNHVYKYPEKQTYGQD